jgi:hypothetical protein
MALDFTHIKGDTFEAVNFQMLVNTVALNLSGCALRMQLRKEYGGVIYLYLNSIYTSDTSLIKADSSIPIDLYSGGGITITNATSGLFRINKQIINIDAGNYIYDIELDKPDGTVKTYISGNFLITNDITR